MRPSGITFEKLMRIYVYTKETHAPFLKLPFFLGKGADK